MLHIKKAFSTAKILGLISKCNNAVEALESKRLELKAVPFELSNETETLKKPEREQKVFKSVSCRAEVSTLKKNVTDSAHEIFYVYTNLLSKEAYKP